MSFGLAGTPTRDLTHVGITLARQGRRGRWLLVPVIIAGRADSSARRSAIWRTSA